MTTNSTLPRVIIDEGLLERLEKLAEGALARFPDLADRLLSELSRAKLVPAEKLPSDVVTIGNRVTYSDETTGKEQTVALVFPEEADIAEGRVSVLTPIGVALLGLREGARFNWQTRAGESRMLKVVRVEAAPSGDDLRSA